MAAIRIGIIGDYQPASPSHQATEAALQHAAGHLGLPLEVAWLPTPALDPVPADPHFVRAFVPDVKILQREQKSGIPGFLTLAAYLAVLAIWSGMVAVAAWALVRLARTRREDEPPLRTGRFDRSAPDRTAVPAAGD